ncbi:MAG TPA: hypothetical protein VK155_19745 [Bacteroidales bacterium]|nr:hypothetical protein [Bacteroidales bacterium]
MAFSFMKHRLTSLLICVGFSYALAAQTGEEKQKINNFTASVLYQTKGISTIPNLTLGKPAFTFDLKIGRRLSFEPQFRFATTGKPWAMVFWWRYNAVSAGKIRLDLTTNYSFSYKTITVTTSGEPQELIRTTRYLVGAAAPEYLINKYFSLGAYIFYNRGIEKFITRNTLMLSFRPSFANIPVAKNITARVNPEIYRLQMDDDVGVYFNARLSISKRNFPVSLSALINIPIKSNIPSEYDLLWNVGISYTFNKQYVERDK